MNSNFQSQFELAARNKTRIQFVNSYKGLPILSEGLIVQVDREVIRVQCDLPQLACLQIEKITFLKSPELQGTIQAQLYSLDPERQEALLTNFGRVKGDIGQRANVRVEPDTGITVVLQAGYHAAGVKAALVDISANGVGVYLDRILYSPRHYAVGANLNIQFVLPPITQVAPSTTPGRPAAPSSNDLATRFSTENLRGTTGMLVDADPKRTPGPVASGSRSPVIVSTHGQVEYCFLAPPYARYRLGISLEQSSSYKAAIMPYIADRQANIIREFRQIYTNLATR